MNNKKKKYVGSFQKEKDAAVLYDKVAIITHGLKVRESLVIYKFIRLKQILIIQKNNLLKF